MKQQSINKLNKELRQTVDVSNTFVIRSPNLKTLLQILEEGPGADLPQSFIHRVEIRIWYHLYEGC